MDQNLAAVIDKRIRRTVEALCKNNFDARYVKDRAELLKVIEEIAPFGQTAGCGGSVTLDEAGVLSFIREHYHFSERNNPGLTEAEKNQIRMDSLNADVYFTSTNAITEDGMLYNVDGSSNRVGAMLFGPRSVIVVAGYNKIVGDLDAARKRVREVAAPANSIRLGLEKNGCYHTGTCVDCQSDTRVCRNFVVMGPQKPIKRVKVLILPERLGY